MKINIKTYLKHPVTILTLALVAAMAIGINHRIQKSRTSEFQNNFDPLAYEQLVTPGDFAPLPIPSGAVKAGRTLELPVLMYHHVGDLPPGAGQTRRSLAVTTSEFEQQVKWLAQAHYHSIRLEDLYLYSLGQFKLPTLPVIFTFDDGYADVFENAVPILRKYGFFGTFAIITHYPKPDELTQQGNNFYASWRQIIQAYQQGNEIVSHTQNHFDGNSAQASPDFIYNNLAGSINDLRERLGFATNVLIYPYGHYTRGYLEQAKRAGFVVGVTVHEGMLINLDDLMEVPRLRVHGGENLDMFISKLRPSN